MALKYQLDTPIIRWIAQGDVDYHEGLKVSLESFDAARKADGSNWHVLANLLESTENRSEQDIRGIADLLVANLDVLSGRLGIVVQAPLQFGVSRMLQAYTDGQGVEIGLFPTEIEANSWLLGKEARG